MELFPCPHVHRGLPQAHWTCGEWNYSPAHMSTVGFHKHTGHVENGTIPLPTCPPWASTSTLDMWRMELFPCPHVHRGLPQAHWTCGEWNYSPAHMSTVGFHKHTGHVENGTVPLPTCPPWASTRTLDMWKMELFPCPHVHFLWAFGTVHVSSFCIIINFLTS